MVGDNRPFWTAACGIAIGLHIAFVLTGLGILFTLITVGAQGIIDDRLHRLWQGDRFHPGSPSAISSHGIFSGGLRIADELYEMMNRWLGHIPGGLASGTILIGAIFAAMAGISGAAIVSMGLVALPSMLKRKYDKRFILGTICAGGALGISNSSQYSGHYILLL